MPGINTNVNSLYAAATLNQNSVAQTNTMQQLSTGLRINSAKDDAAGLAIATKMASNIRGVAVATRNANDGISMAQTAESALGSVTNMLQRMRELAVQASNGTLTSANRASMQIEVKQLAAEIDNIGKTANFNGIKLFDGSASSISLQTNVNSGDVVKMGIGVMNSNSMGLGSRSSLQSFGYQVNSAGGAYAIVNTNISAGGLNKGLTSGDLTINGVMIGSSQASDDALSWNDKVSSAISKAAAINKSSAATGVTATVNKTVASGVSMSASSATATGTFTINGVSTSAFTVTTNAATTRQNVIAAINGISGATGVRAVDTNADATGIQLIADDGRNIHIYSNSLTGTVNASVTGVGAKDLGTTAYTSSSDIAIYTGTYTLQSNTSSPITIGTTVTGDITRAGLAVGSYSANTSVMMSANRASVAAGTSSTALASGDLMINGVAIGASLSTDDTFSVGISTAGNKDSSAIAIAAAINKQSALTGVRAVAQANIVNGTSFDTTGVSANGNLLLNGSTIAITKTASSKAVDIVQQINLYSGATGVVASDNGSGISLTAADGRNIEIGLSAASLTLANLGFTASTGDSNTSRTINGGTLTSAANIGTATATTVFSAGVSLVSDKTFTVAAGTGSSALSHLKTLGIEEGTYGGSNNGSKISTVDISTLSGAQDALNAVDAALGQVSDQRSNLGAIQNRLQSAVDNLTSSSTNLQAAQGRIQDTDYSTATQAMSKSQIISQAATAMLAQANQQPQLVLSLLK